MQSRTTSCSHFATFFFFYKYIFSTSFLSASQAQLTNKMACSLAYILLFSLLFAPCLTSELKREHCYKECEEALDKHERKRCELLCLEREGEGEQEEEEKSPFLFGEQSFKHWIRSEHGYFKVLERFSKKSPLLMGIENYRVAILQVDPKTFVMPNHWDAHEVFYVINGILFLFSLFH